VLPRFDPEQKVVLVVVALAVERRELFPEFLTGYVGVQQLL
jgi:hypothetical protein